MCYCKFCWTCLRFADTLTGSSDSQTYCLSCYQESNNCRGFLKRMCSRHGLKQIIGVILQLFSCLAIGACIVGIIFILLVFAASYNLLFQMKIVGEKWTQITILDPYDRLGYHKFMMYTPIIIPLYLVSMVLVQVVLIVPMFFCNIRMAC